MASQRTEPATPRRRQEARRRGQVARSHDLTQGAALLAAVAAGALALPGGFLTYAEYTRRVLTSPDPGRLASLLAEGVLAATWLAGPVAGAALVAGLATGAAQTGGLLSGKPLQPSLDRLNPLRALERLFSLRSAVEVLKALLKVTAVAVAVWGPFWEVVSGIPPVVSSPAVLASWMGSTVHAVVLRGALALALLGGLDYLYQRFEYERALRMTKQEVREELRETEGDPLVRSRQRARARELARRRMLRDVARATVVVTNPVHVAVALRYAPREAPAPVVVAKGARRVAERIREEAARHRVPVVENPPLAWALYRGVPLGRMIPPALYHAVAELLAALYRSGQLREVPW
ncbi:MAG: EscU/YscU/HrcU family type III secretion system export apparatus switch protein [Armatimonadota bacterium]|nr:EscU/YscU/HrcU family type III secretion system export apparatus switch protein [Armatimonadota bacterium]MDR7439020.1 EscU/YscU/HrcU family type III secretion system export apparatus switch protein [Armatimonadota bacterium]MDR7563606.1 EscU/YscU/HrcU family type III secretion system export apparatus switch protein [Armatimonadota bacterium]MDR7566854.1 EscU/YscU/HrcU family type III secretion system export apparatus switch protein [Armatimonadota bacterium]MDR7601211.1 EscU/YscU/HrcU famil